MVRSKKILAFALLLIVAAPIFFFVGFLAKEKAIQHEMKEKLENSLLQTITVNKQDFRWVKKNREIIIEGRLFDVKHYRINKNEVTFTGLYDEAESRLKKDIAALVNEEERIPGLLEQLLFEFIFSGAIKKSSTTLHLAFDTNKMKATYYSYSEAAVMQTIQVVTPPPNI
jgi:hypothetical protein